MRVVGIFAPFCPRGYIRGTIRHIEPKGVLGTCARCPKQRYATEEPGKVLGRDPVGIVEGTSGCRARGVSIRGNSLVPSVQEYWELPCG